MSLKHLLCAGLIWLTVLVGGKAEGVSGAAGKTEWRLGLQAYTFRALTLFETLDKAQGLGLKYLEMYPGQKLKPGSDVKTGPGLSEDEVAELRAKLLETGVKLVSYGVAPIPTEPAAARRLFEWAAKMGVEVLVTEAAPNATLDALSQEFGIKVAVHNHPRTWPPEKVLAATAGMSPQVGACADVGHWKRAGLDTVATLARVGDRVIHNHFKDLAPLEGDVKTPEGVLRMGDVPWGTGQCDARGMLMQLRRQNYQGYFIIEYERGTVDELTVNLRECIRFFNQVARESAAITMRVGAEFRPGQMAGYAPYYLRTNTGHWVLQVDADLTGYEFGAAQARFAGPTGYYDVTLNTQGDADGRCEYHLLVAGKPAGEPYYQPKCANGQELPHTWGRLLVHTGDLLLVKSNGSDTEKHAPGKGPGGFHMAHGRWTSLVLVPVSLSPPQSSPNSSR